MEKKSTLRGIQKIALDEPNRGALSPDDVRSVADTFANYALLVFDRWEVSEDATYMLLPEHKEKLQDALRGVVRLQLGLFSKAHGWSVEGTIFDLHARDKEIERQRIEYVSDLMRNIIENLSVYDNLKFCLKSVGV